MFETATLNTNTIIAPAESISHISAIICYYTQIIDMSVDLLTTSNTELSDITHAFMASNTALATTQISDIRSNNDNTSVTDTIELAGEHVVWLNIMCERYNHIDINHTLHILLYYCRTYSDQRFIYTKIRCRTCGRKFTKPTLNITLNNVLHNYINDMYKQYSIASYDKVFRVILDYVQEGRQVRGSTDAQKAAVLNKLEHDIFVTKHCEHDIAHEYDSCVNEQQQCHIDAAMKLDI